MRNVFRARLKRGMLLGGALLVLWLAAPQLGFRERGEPSLRFAHTFTTESERQILAALVSEFQQTHPGLKVEQIISNSETYNTLGWRLQFRGGHPPDIYFQWQGYRVEKAIDEGWALELTPFLSPGFLEAFVPSTRPRQRNGVYFLPHSVDLSNLVWFNRSIFERLNAQAPGSLPEWIRFCLTLRENRILALAQGNRDLWPMGNVAAEFLGKELGPGPLERLFAPGATIRAGDLRGLNSLLALKTGGALDLPGILSPSAIGRFGDIDAKVMFLNQKSAQHIVGSWFLADIEDAEGKGELKFPVGFFPLPGEPNRPEVLTAVTTGFMVHRATRHPREAAALLELLLSAKYQTKFAELGALSARADAERFTRHPIALEMLAVLERGPQIIPPPDTAYPLEEAAIFYELCGKLLLGELGLADVAPYWSKEKIRLARKTL